MDSSYKSLKNANKEDFNSFLMKKTEDNLKSAISAHKLIKHKIKEVNSLENMIKDSCEFDEPEIERFTTEYFEVLKKFENQLKNDLENSKSSDSKTTTNSDGLDCLTSRMILKSSSNSKSKRIELLKDDKEQMNNSINYMIDDLEKNAIN